MKNKLVVIQGPTAVGKTTFAIELAKKLNTVILSADSRQFYKEMSIGTAKPSLDEQGGIKHYFIDSHHVVNPITAAQFETEALKILEYEFKKNQVIVLIGGSGLFIDALCDGLDKIPTNTKVREQIEQEIKNDGLEKLLEELEIKDETYFHQVDKKNPVRIIRAIEVIRITGKKYSELRQNKSEKRPFESHKFVLNLPRENLYHRINERVELMVERGLLDEVKLLLPYRNLSSLNTVGYTEFFDFLDGKIDFESAKELIKQNSRRYAKRQLTWFRRNENAIWLDASNLKGNLELILNLVG